MIDSCFDFFLGEIYLGLQCGDVVEISPHFYIKRLSLYKQLWKCKFLHREADEKDSRTDNP